MIFEQIPVKGDRNFAYLIGDDSTGHAAIVDPGYAPEATLATAERHGLNVKFVISTHSHKDHIAGNSYVLERTAAVEVMHESTPHPCQRRVRDNDELSLGAVPLKFLHTPGHIPDHVCILTVGKLITGDILFVGKVGGTGGPHFPASDPSQQWQSLCRLMTLDPATEVWPGHDYGIAPSSTIGHEIATNPFLLCKTYEEFIHLKKTWADFKKLHNIK